MQKIELKRWFDNEQAIADYRAGVALLEKSGVFALLTRIGIPSLVAYGSDINIMASQGAWSNGYQTSIEHMRYFVEQFDPAKQGTITSAPAVDYGGIAEALRKGDLTKEEADKLL